MAQILFMGLGGFIGTLLRYGAQLAVTTRYGSAFPLGTLTVNLTGCFLIGLFYGLAARYQWMTQGIRLFLVTGVCGGYTTFSSFSYESISLLKQGNYFYLSAYLAVSVFAGLMATLAGLSLIR